MFSPLFVCLSDIIQQGNFILVQFTCMCQAECPQAEVARSVGDASQAELNGVNGLEHELVCKIKLEGSGSNDRDMEEQIKVGKKNKKMEK